MFNGLSRGGYFYFYAGLVMSCKIRVIPNDLTFIANENSAFVHRDLPSFPSVRRRCGISVLLNNCGLLKPTGIILAAFCGSGPVVHESSVKSPHPSDWYSYQFRCLKFRIDDLISAIHI